MKKLFLKFVNWLRNRKRVKKYSHTIFVESILDVPEKIGKRIYVVDRGGTKRWAVFLCACSRKNRVEVNLMKTKEPHWELSISNGKITLSPSVVVTGKCSCHFWLRNSKAYLC